jgi:DNA-binding transcriptional regulator GbsR (MarR family)
MGILQVKDRPDLVKDDVTKAVLNTDATALDAYRRRREAQREVKTMCQEIDDIKNDIADIKSLLREIINNRIGD